MHELEQRVLDPARASSEQQPAPSSSSSLCASLSNTNTAHEVPLEPLLAVKAEPKTEPEMETKQAEHSTEPDDFDDADADALGLGDWRSKHI